MPCIYIFSSYAEDRVEMIGVYGTRSSHEHGLKLESAR